MRGGEGDLRGWGWGGGRGGEAQPLREGAGGGEAPPFRGGRDRALPGGGGRDPVGGENRAVGRGL